MKKVFWWRKDSIVYAPGSSNFQASNISELEKRSLRESLGLNATAPLVVAMTPIGTGRGLAMVRDVWERVQRAAPETTLAFIGSASDATRREFEHIPNVTFLGYLEAGQAADWIKVSGIYLSPLDDGMTGRRSSVLSAMAQGVAVVTNRGHLSDPEFFEKSPLVMVNYQVDELSNAVINLLKDPNRTRDVGLATARFYEENLAWEKNLKRILG